MTKEEMIAALKASKLQESNATNVKDAEDTLQNIETKEVKDAPKADGVTGLDSELPTQKDIEKEVAKDEGPIVPADKDGVSKNGGESDKMEAGKVEAEKKKEDNGMKDVINVSDRKVEEAAEVHNELLAQLQEASAREEGYKAKIAEINSLCEKALKAQAEQLTKDHAAEMNRVFESVIAEGEKMEKELIKGVVVTNDEGVVIGQSLRAGSTITKGSTLTVTIATKPKETPKPTPSTSPTPSPTEDTE